MHDARAARALCLHWLALSTFSLSLSSFFSHSSEDLPNSDDVKDLKERRQKGNDNKIDNKKSLKDRNKKEYDIISKSNCLRPACSDIEKKMQSSLAGLSESVVGLGSKNSIGIAGDLGPIV